MVVQQATIALGAVVQLFVLLIGLAAAGFVFTRSRAAGVVFGVGVLVAGAGVLARAGLDLAFTFGVGVDSQAVIAGGTLVVSLIEGLGVLGLVVAACVGPAPHRDGDDEEDA